MANRPGVVIYTDGACSGNPGPGGWGVLMRFGEVERELCGGEAETTNNRMELTAAIEGLRAVRKSYEGKITLWTDSTYVRDGITKWIHGWKKRGWKKADKKPVLNVDLWKELDAINSRCDVNWKWVKGHVGVDGNERADELARRGAANFRV
ncbi:MAG: ribonuclease HI [Hyphomonadaceae bacterium]|nr:ribonuclease HI [Hyphomonadaceae bacterium]MBC6413097.1 ribonuclease HI [Hyphomonadaceae bacterium]